MRTVNKSQPDTFGLFIQSRCHPFIANALWDRLGRNGEPKPVWRTNDRGILKTLKDFLGLGVNNSRRANAVFAFRVHITTPSVGKPAAKTGVFNLSPQRLFQAVCRGFDAISHRFGAILILFSRYSLKLPSNAAFIRISNHNSTPVCEYL